MTTDEDPGEGHEGGSGRTSVAFAPERADQVLPPRTVSRWRFGLRGPDGGARTLGLLLIAMLAVLCVVLAVIGVMKVTADAAGAARAAAAYTPPPAARAAGAQTEITVIGDAASGASSGSTAWPAAVAAALKAQVNPTTAAGEGWITKGAGGATMVSEAAKVSPTSTVVVFFGGASDASQTALAVVTAVNKAIAEVRKQAPRAKILIIGPASSAAKPPRLLLRVRDAERTAAQSSKVHWADPIAAKWLSGRSGVVGSGGVPTDAGQKLLAASIERALKSLV